MRLSMFVLLVAVLVTPRPASGGIDSLKRDVAAKKVTFDRAMAAARTAALRKIDAEIRKVTRVRWPASARVSLIQQLSHEKQQFERHATWPDNGDFAPLAYTYAMHLNRHYAPVAVAYEKLIHACLLAGELAMAERYTQEKLEFDNHLPGRNSLTAGSWWNGTLASDSHSTTFHLGITHITGSLFEAVVHQNPSVAGHPIFELRGTIDGIRVRCISSRIIHGDARSLAFDGFVLGDKLILHVAGVDAHRKSIPGHLVWLKRQ